MNVLLMGRHDEILEELVDAHEFLLEAIDGWKGPPDARLRRIDQFDVIDFETDEMEPLITEIEAVRAGVEKRELQKILRAVERLARRCDAEGLRLRFSGD
jgi:hypothetical protein